MVISKHNKKRLYLYPRFEIIVEGSETSFMVSKEQFESILIDELFLLYIDDDDEMHITQKAVTGATYRNYEQGDSITLFYRNNNVYDTFVQAESMKEVWPAFLNFFTFILGLYVVSVFSFIRKWRKKRQSKQEQSEVSAVHN